MRRTGSRSREAAAQRRDPAVPGARPSEGTEADRDPPGPTGAGAAVSSTARGSRGSVRGGAAAPIPVAVELLQPAEAGVRPAPWLSVSRHAWEPQTRAESPRTDAAREPRWSVDLPTEQPPLPLRRATRSPTATRIASSSRCNPRGTRAEPELHPRLRCGGGRDKARRKRERHRESSAERPPPRGNRPEPPRVGEPGPGLRPLVGVLVRKKKRDGAVPEPWHEAAAGGTVPGSAGQFVSLPEGVRGPSRPGPAALRGPPARPGQRKQQRSRCTGRPPGSRGQRQGLPGRPTGSWSRGATRPRVSTAHADSGPVSGSRARCRLGDSFGPARTCAGAANPVSARLTPNPPLGCRVSAPPTRTREMNFSGLSGPPRHRVPGSPLVSRCAGFSTATSFATKPGGCSPSRRRAWGGGASTRVRAQLSLERRGGPGSNPTPAPSIPALQPGIPPRLPCTAVPVLQKLLRPTSTRGGTAGSDPDPDPVPRVAEDAGAPCISVYATVSLHCVDNPSPGRPQHGPHSGTTGGDGGRANRPLAEPQGPPVPEPTPQPGWPSGPGKGILQPGYRRAVYSAPRSPIPRELPECVDTPHTLGAASLGSRSAPPTGCLDGWARTEDTAASPAPPGPRPFPGLGTQPGPRDVAFSFPSISRIIGEAETGSELRHQHPKVPLGMLPGSAEVPGEREDAGPGDSAEHLSRTASLRSAGRYSPVTGALASRRSDRSEEVQPSGAAGPQSGPAAAPGPSRASFPAQAPARIEGSSGQEPPRTEGSGAPAGAPGAVTRGKAGKGPLCGPDGGEKPPFSPEAQTHERSGSLPHRSSSWQRFTRVLQISAPVGPPCPEPPALARLTGGAPTQGASTGSPDGKAPAPRFPGEHKHELFAEGEREEPARVRRGARKRERSGVFLHPV
ncbi:collagen alpha-1(I) chain-like [Manacus candei]|uniref:collagen alpha-1(I) chain-like n=1 Tax=Manacus candei TaxID=415023 RepID=UPI002226E01E|nr:collagen alpha-1(I) chain-like [Manacus candei]